MTPEGVGARGAVDAANIFYELGFLPTPNDPLEPSARLRDDLGVDSQELAALVEAAASLCLMRSPVAEQDLVTVADVVAWLAAGRDSWLPTDVRFVLQGSIVVSAPQRAVFACIDDYAAWPAALKHVTAIEPDYAAGRFQSFHMHIEELTTRERYSVRSLRYVNPVDGVIDFAQPEPPRGFARHVGGWRFRAIDESSTELISFHGFDVGALAPDQAITMIRRHIQAALTTWGGVGARR